MAIANAEAIRRGQRAENILQDDLVKESIQKLRDQALDEFKQASASDIEAVRNAKALYDATERFVNLFAKYMRDGKYEQLRQVEAKPKS